MTTDAHMRARETAQVVADVPAATTARASIHTGVVGDADAHRSSPVRPLLA